MPTCEIRRQVFNFLADPAQTSATLYKYERCGAACPWLGSYPRGTEAAGLQTRSNVEGGVGAASGGQRWPEDRTKGAPEKKRDEKGKGRVSGIYFDRGKSSEKQTAKAYERSIWSRRETLGCGPCPPFRLRRASKYYQPPSLSISSTSSSSSPPAPSVFLLVLRSPSTASLCRRVSFDRF